MLITGHYAEGVGAQPGGISPIVAEGEVPPRVCFVAPANEIDAYDSYLRFELPDLSLLEITKQPSCPLLAKLGPTPKVSDR